MTKTYMNMGIIGIKEVHNGVKRRRIAGLHLRMPMKGLDSEFPGNDPSDFANPTAVNFSVKLTHRVQFV